MVIKDWNKRRNQHTGPVGAEASEMYVRQSSERITCLFTNTTARTCVPTGASHENEHLKKLLEKVKEVELEIAAEEAKSAAQLWDCLEQECSELQTQNNNLRYVRRHCLHLHRPTGKHGDECFTSNLTILLSSFRFSCQ